jgi:HAD superfamily hydrolase (TIGR01490 family)
MILALFDADGTLYTGQFGRGLMKYSSSHGRQFFSQRYYAGVLPAYALYKMKFGSRENMQHALLANLSGMLQGLDQEQAIAALTWLAHEYLLPTQRADVVERLKEHKAKGHKVIIVSGMFMECAEIFKEHFGIEAVIGTQAEFKDGRYTGKTIPPLISGTAKAEKIHELVKSRGWDVDWTSSYAYGDSITDVHMLNLVGNPVAVYPDKKLHRLTKEKNWEVLGTPKE